MSLVNPSSWACCESRKIGFGACVIRPGMHSFRQKALASLKAKIRNAFDGCAVYIQTLPTRQESSASSGSSSDEEEEIPEDYVACLTVLTN